jgi:LuxR family maltose regulon positive regulatory protein
VNAEPALAIFRAWALAFTGQWEMMEDALTAVNEDAAPGEVTAVRAYAASVKAEVAKTYELAEEAMAQLPEEKDFLRALVQFCVGITRSSSGRPAAASQALEEVIRLSRAAGHPHLLMTATVHFGHIQEMQGLLRQALQTLHEALHLTPGSGGRPVPFTGVAYVGIAEILYEWNDLDEALRHATEGVKLTKRGGFVGTMLAGYACLLRVYQAQGNFTRIEKTLQTAERLAEKTEYRYMQGVFAEIRARLWVAQENLAAAQRWARAHRLRPGDELDLAREVEQMAVVRILIAQATIFPGDGTAPLTEVQTLLSRLLEAAEAAGRTGSLIKILALRAAVLQMCGEGAQALSVLARAFSLARPEKYVRTFVDEGAPMANLLRKALAEGIVPDYAATLLAAFDETTRTGSTIRAPLVEPLSEREIEVLRLIVAGFSNREIARELVIAISTVKSHINNIYGKLGVANRDEAILRARALRLL